jgi:hypothetical protein
VRLLSGEALSAAHNGGDVLAPKAETVLLINIRPEYHVYGCSSTTQIYIDFKEPKMGGNADAKRPSNTPGYHIAGCYLTVIS